MTQLYYRANLSDAQFPLVSTFQGKTIIQPQLDQNYTPAPLGSSEERDKGIPEAWYLHNVLPSLYGYKSVGYNKAVNGVTDATGFIRVFAVKDFAGNRGHIAITDTKTYLITASSTTWKDVTPAGQPLNADVTAADATGSSFICYAKFGIFTINLTTKTISPAAISWDSPLTNASMVGIASSNNYLLAHDGSTLYWSSALDVLDFKASQITGAGKGTPTAVVGTIIALAKVGIGFAIYCQGNIVVATFSGNVQYPWIFKEAPNGSGLASIYHLTTTGDEGSNYAWTAAGLLRVTLAGCTAINPEVTDFLTGRIFEDYDSATDTLTTQFTTSKMVVRIAFISSRYLCISYGLSELTHCLVYDTSMKRWGKLKITHVQVFDLSFSIAVTPYVTYEDFGTVTYSELFPYSYADFIPSSSVSAPEAKHSIALLQADGTIQLANFDFGNFNSDAVLILGKYQVFRANTVAVQGFTIETIDAVNTDFEAKVLTSADGKNTSIITTPYETVEPNMRSYDCLVIGQNHSLRIKGSFHMVGLLMIFTKNGNR